MIKFEDCGGGGHCGWLSINRGLGTLVPNGSRNYLYEQMSTNRVPAYVALSILRRMYDGIETPHDPVFIFMNQNKQNPGIKYVLDHPLEDGRTLYKETGVGVSAKMVSEFFADFFLKGPEPLWLDEMWATLLNYTDLFRTNRLNLVLLAKYKNRYKVVPLKPLRRLDNCFFIYNTGHNHWQAVSIGGQYFVKCAR